MKDSSEMLEETPVKAELLQTAGWTSMESGVEVESFTERTDTRGDQSNVLVPVPKHIKHINKIDSLDSGCESVYKPEAVLR